MQDFFTEMHPSCTHFHQFAACKKFGGGGAVIKSSPNKSLRSPVRLSGRQSSFLVSFYDEAKRWLFWFRKPKSNKVETKGQEGLVYSKRPLT
jgi:hypothetical protein